MRPSFAAQGVVALLLVVLSPDVRAQWIQQTNVLKPGWNAVFLEVQPEPRDCDALFSGLPIESVWDFNRSVDAPQFVQDPSTLLPGAPGWLTWFPPEHPLAGQGNLFVLRDGRPYLIKLADNAAPVNWTVTGRPSLRKTTWHPGGLNLVGFRVGNTGPTFQSLFAGEAGLAGQPVYALNGSGVWEQVSPSTARPESGKAYWVRCVSPAQRTAGLEVNPGSQQGLAFIGGVAEQSIRIRNAGASPRNISVRLLSSTAPPTGQPALAGPVPLEYWRADYAATNLGWEPFPATLSFASLPAGQEWNIRLGVRRDTASAVTPGSQFQSVLEVTDDLGTRWWVPISADPAASSVALSPQGVGDDEPRAGLWIGEAVINAVSQPAHPGDPSLPRPAGGSFSFRLILHVDDAGTARLLQQVYLVRKPPVSEPDPEHPGFNRIVQPARTIPVTDAALIPGIIGTGEIIGRRVSSAAFASGPPLVFAGGAFGDPAGAGLTATTTLGYNDPLNPFRHVYHPDHNNLDERFEQTLPEGKESFTISRTVTLAFSDVDPLGLNPPGWGDTELGGTYRENMTGLHRNPIHIAGNFRLVRVLREGALNGAVASPGLARAGGAAR